MTAPLNLTLDRAGPDVTANPEPPAGNLFYLCLQQTVEGQASHAHVHEIIQGLTSLGWNVTLHEIQADRTRHHGKLYFLWHYLAPSLKLWRTPVRPDVMYIRADPLALPAFLWARLRRIPVVQEVNGPYGDRLIAKAWLRPFARTLAALQRYQYRRSEALIAVTAQLEHWLRREAPDVPVYLVPNAANTELFHPGVINSLDTPRRYVTFFGLLAPWQGIPLLLDAIAHRDWPEAVDIVIAGDGDEAERVRAAAAADRRIKYWGTIPYAKVPELVAGSVAGLSLKTSIPGRADTGMSPLKLYETLACGVPAIVTEYHGQSEIVRELGAGLVVPQHDPAALARAVARLTNNEGERREMGRRGAAAVQRQHSWHHRAEQVNRLLQDVIAAGSARRSRSLTPRTL